MTRCASALGAGRGRRRGKAALVMLPGSAMICTGSSMPWLVGPSGSIRTVEGEQHAGLQAGDQLMSDVAQHLRRRSGEVEHDLLRTLTTMRTQNGHVHGDTMPSSRPWMSEKEYSPIGQPVRMPAAHASGATAVDEGVGSLRRSCSSDQQLEQLVQAALSPAGWPPPGPGRSPRRSSGTRTLHGE